MQDFKRINIASDGNCLFRSVATFLDTVLITCKRYNNGKPKNKNLYQKESITADNLRKFVVFRLSQEDEAENYNKWEDYDSDEYDDIYHRLKYMKKSGTWAGMLELKQLAIMLNIKFNIYVIKTILHKFNHKDIDTIYANSNDSNSDSNSIESLDINIDIDEEDEEDEDEEQELNIISCVGDNNHTECNLLLEDNHYELLIIKETDTEKNKKNKSDIKNKGDIKNNPVEVVEPFNICLPHRYNLRNKR